MTVSDFDELEHIAKIPLSVDEFDLIVEKYSGKYYFIDRLLCKIATDNGINPDSVPVQPEIGQKLEAMAKAEQYVKKFINEFDGEARASLELLVSDKTAQKLEREATGNYVGVSLDADAQAKRLVTTALSKPNLLSRASYLANAIRTSKPETGEKILEMLAEKDDPIIKEYPAKMLGVTEAAERFRETDLENIRVAKKAIDSIRAAKNKPQRMAVIADNIHNRRFREAVQREIEETGNKELKGEFETAIEVSEEAKTEQ